jgi:hypothetical protein
LTCLLATVALGGNPTRGLSAEDSAKLLERVLTAHRSARESIRTLQAQFKHEELIPRQVETGSGTYLRSPEGVLVRAGKEGKVTRDTLVKTGEARTVSRNWPKENKINFRATLDTGTQMIGLSDIWQRLMLSHYGPNQQTLPFEQYIETATGPVRASSSREEGREIVTVTAVFSVGDGKDQYLIERRDEFDGGVNYLIRKSTQTVSGEDGRTEGVIEEFLEAQPGVFVPIRNRARSYKGSTVEGEWLYSISNIVVNAPVSADRLKLPAIPSGTILNDRIHETEYPVNENWVRIGPAKPSPKVRAPAPSQPSEFKSPSTSEPRSTAHFIMIGSVALIVAGGAAWAVRRWRRRGSTV